MLVAPVITASATVKIAAPLNARVADFLLHPDIVVCHCRNVIAAQAFDHQVAVIHAITVEQMASGKENGHPVMRQIERTQIVIPKMIVGHKGEVVHAEAEIHVQRRLPVEKEADADLEGCRWRQWRPAAIAVRFPPANP